MNGAGWEAALLPADKWPQILGPDDLVNKVGGHYRTSQPDTSQLVRLYGLKSNLQAFALILPALIRPPRLMFISLAEGHYSTQVYAVTVSCLLVEYNLH